ncbi:MAG: YjbH domain-containing protein [Terriglobia bacterium]|nr:YjbH domain-containing protein [Terriglobia bacterium]
MKGAGQRGLLMALLIGTAICVSPLRGLAQDASTLPLPRTTYGVTGLIEMPSARMAPDGQINITASYMKDIQHYNLGFQALPWLDFTFRYSAIGHFPFNPGNGQPLEHITDYDRSFALKARLFQEGEYRPAVAIGANDFIGTGLFSAEYIVASKHFFDNFDVSLGAGWGRFGTANTLPNPLGLLFPSFKTRAGITGTGGTFDIGQLFHGPHLGIFGGVAWRSPLDGLSLIAEYSSDKYADETRFGIFKPRMQLNLGANYQITDDLQLGLDWLYGDTIGITLSFAIDPTRDQYPTKLGPQPPPPQIRSSEQQLAALETLQREVYPSQRARHSFIAAASFADTLMEGDLIRDISIHGNELILAAAPGSDNSAFCNHIAIAATTYDVALKTVEIGGSGKPIRCAVPTVAATDNPSGIDLGTTTALETAMPRSASAAAAAIRKDAAEQDLNAIAVSIAQGEATVYFENTRYSSDSEAVGRLVRVLMNDAPPDVEIFHFIRVVGDIPAQEYQILRGSMERMIEQNSASGDFHGGVSMTPPPLRDQILSEELTFSYPRFDWAIFPELNESLFDPSQPVRIGLSAGVSGTLHLFPGLSLNAMLEGNIWNDFNTKNPPNSLLPHVRSDFVQYFVHGADGIADLEAQYRFRLAPTVFVLAKVGYLENMFGGAGGEILWRPENSRLAFGIDAYEVWQRKFDRLFGFQNYHVITGHATFYYQSPWYGMNFRLMAGRYLAGDHGVTIEVTRHFSTGVEIGAFATFTNVPFKTFGEGSFDKGFVIRIPLDWALPVSSQSAFNLDLRPLTRDGGQRLNNDTAIYDDLQRNSAQDFNEHWDSIVNP